MNKGFAIGFLSWTVWKNYMVGCSSAAAAAIYRRQHFLVRCLGLGGYSKNWSCYNSNYPHSTIRMQSAMTSGHALEADAGGMLRSIMPILDTSRHKGQAGKPFVFIFFFFFKNIYIYTIIM